MDDQHTDKPAAPLARIMVVDDDSTVRELLERELTARGYQVFTAANGLKLVSVLKIHKPDLILLDIMMSWIDGYELCKLVKSVDVFRHIPVIFISRKNLPEDIDYGFACGAADYLTKPFEINDLVRHIQDALTKAQAAQ